jgi:phosphoglycerate kinase
MNVVSLESINVKAKRVLLRCDLNVPIKDGEIKDDGRIRASLPTIQYLLDQGASIVITAHLGRPKGERKPELSLAPVAIRLEELLGRKVIFSSEIIDAKVSQIQPGEIVLLENIRYESAETSKDEAERLVLARVLASYADVFVSDGFGAVHRKHASVYDVATLLPHAAGYLVAAEVEVLKKLTLNPARPYGVVLGGAKVSDKIGVISNLLDKVNVLAIGGGMLFTFLAAQGYEIGKSLVEVDLIPTVKEILARAEKLGVKLLLPTDIVVAPEFSIEAKPTLVSASEIPSDQMGLDIGPESANTFATAILECETVFWNGPMGVFEFPSFADGTRVIATALSEIKGLSVVGGGDSAAAVRVLGFADSDFGYISTGGGASLEYLEGKDLPGIIVLQ